MSLIQRQNRLVARLEPIYKKAAEAGYLGNDTIGAAARAKRGHIKEMLEAGYTELEAAESAEACSDTAWLNVRAE